MQYLPNTFLNLHEDKCSQQQFQFYFPKGLHWRTSQYFQNQSYEQFYIAVRTFFKEIQKQKGSPKLDKENSDSLENLFCNLIDKQEFSLNAMERQLETAVEILQISLQTYLLPAQIKSYGEKNPLQAKIIIEKQHKQLSFIFGLQNQNLRVSNSPQILENELNMQKLNKQQDIPKKEFTFLKQNQNPQKLIDIQNNGFIKPTQQNLDNIQIKHNQNLQIQHQYDIQIKQKKNLQIQHQYDIQIINKKNLQLEHQYIQQIKPNQQYQQFNPLKLNIQFKPQQNQQIKAQVFSKDRNHNQFVLNTNQIQYIQTQEIQSQQSYRNLNLFIAEPNQIQLIECNICNRQYEKCSEEQLFLPCCKVIVDKKCIQEELLNTEEVLWNKKCSFCHKNYEINFLKQNMSLNIFQETIKKQLLDNYFNECFNCKAKISKSYGQNIYKIECENCKTTVCSICLKEFHGFDQICEDQRKLIFQFFRGQPIIVCPFCNLIQTKDDGCNHVTCFKCRMDLCSECSVDRRPILSHGNQFHRKGCIDYRVEKGKEAEIKYRNRECQLCIQSQDRYCYIPIDLETYKKEKGFLN